MGISVPVGGLRHRLIKESLYNMIRDSLAQLGWFDTVGRNHLPISFRTVEVQSDEEIPLNTCVLADADYSWTDGELGSNLAENSWTYYLDFYAESDAIGQHFIGDCGDILAGRISRINRARTSFPVWNYTHATPFIMFYADIEDVLIDRAHDFPRPWQKHWYSVRFFVTDAYGDEVDDADFTGP